jgi:predicted nucleic acid-binding protein
VAALVDTNILVYSVDSRFPEKRRIATAVLRNGILADDVRVPHQAILEFFSVVSRPLSSGDTLLSPDEARRETEEFLAQFVVLYPNETIVRTALRATAAYRLPWFDAHLWAYADYYGLTELISEDFQHGRMYGGVRAINPFAAK